MSRTINCRFHHRSVMLVAGMCLEYGCPFIKCLVHARKPIIIHCRTYDCNVILEDGICLNVDEIGKGCPKVHCRVHKNRVPMSKRG